MKRYSIYKTLTNIDKTLSGKILVIFFINVVVILLSFIHPYIYKTFVDRVLGKKEWSMLLYVCLGFIFLFIINNLSSITLTYFTNKLNNILSFKLKVKLITIYLNMHFSKMNRFNTGELKTILEGDTNKLVSFISSHIIDTIINFGYVIVYFIALLFINWQMTLVFLILSLISILFNKLISTKVEENNVRNRNATSEFSNWLFSCFYNWKEIKANSIETVQENTFVKYGEKFIRIGNKNVLYWTISRLIAAFKTDLVMYAGIFFIGAFYVVNDIITVGTVLMYISYLSVFLRKIDEIIELNIDFKSSQYHYDKVISLLDEMPTGKNIKAIPGNLSSKLEIRNLCFSYNDDKKILNNINLLIGSGEKLAIVGKSGHGKTTLIKCIIGMCIPQSGEIIYRGIDINENGGVHFYRDLGLVMQDPIIFNLTINENLLLGSPKASESDIIQACKCAEIDDFIHTLPNQYNTLIGEKGIRLSGGQKQRLAIARALLTNPKFIIFDEATSALNYELEQKINNNIATNFSDVTFVHITHRLSSLVSCDRIVVINEGEIVGDGKFGDLLENNQSFIQLYKDQYQKQYL